MPAASPSLSSVADAWRDAADDFDAAALRVFEAQRARVPAYAAWCAHELGSRTSPEVASWRDIPALPIAAFKQLDVFEPGAPVAATWESSGTTAGERSQHRLQETTQYEDALVAGVRAALVPDVTVGRCAPLACVQLQPSGDQATHSSLTFMYDRIRRGSWATDAGVYVDGDYRLDARGAWEALAARAAAGEPVLLLATSFALAMLLDAAEEHGWAPLRLPDRSRVVDTGGFKGRTREITRGELLIRVGQLLGVPASWCENEYGMSELSSQAWLGTVAASAGMPLAPAPAPGARWTPPWLRVRVVDPASLAEVADGEQGLLVFHDLANVWSCAAIRSEDLGIRRGDGFELLGRAPGAALKGCSLRLEDVARA